MPDPTLAVTARRLRQTPVVDFGAAPGYGPIFNAGLIVVDGVFHLFARGVRDGYVRNEGPGPRFLDYVSDVLVFTSENGLDYSFQQVLATGGDEGAHSLEDPRVQRIRACGGEHVLMTYTYLPEPASGEPWQVGMHRLAYGDGRFALNLTSGRIVGPTGVPDKDAVLFNLRDGRVALIHRIHPNIQLAIFDSLEHLYGSDGDYWDAHMSELERHTLIRPAAGGLGVGAGAPPVDVDGALLLFYHERDADSCYTINAALLDHETGALVSLLDQPILRPELPWERNGDVDDVVFVQGAIEQADGTVYLTYGAADRCVGAAEVEAAPLIDALRAAA
jgi:beta-1,2-mannobiose phosphorylase / 1,2-beta-oligomannan phosphorylase